MKDLRDLEDFKDARSQNPPGTMPAPRAPTSSRAFSQHPTLETIQGQIDGLFSQLPYKCYLEDVASVGDKLKICP